jgi:hypothetical protein
MTSASPDDEETIDSFPRAICHDELPAVGAKVHERFPLTFEGLREEYEQTAAAYERGSARESHAVTLSGIDCGHDEDGTCVRRAVSWIR